LEGAIECDGRPQAYEQEYEESLVRILGEEFRGKKYTEYYFTCGQISGENEPHAPHKETVMTWATEYRKCGRCGHENKEVC
jgi:hypothetical protein